MWTVEDTRKRSVETHRLWIFFKKLDTDIKKLARNQEKTGKEIIKWKRSVVFNNTRLNNYQ